MDFSLKHLAATTLMLASLSSFTTAAHANITPQPVSYTHLTLPTNREV